MQYVILFAALLLVSEAAFPVARRAEDNAKPRDVINAQVKTAQQFTFDSSTDITYRNFELFVRRLNPISCTRAFSLFSPSFLQCVHS